MGQTTELGRRVELVSMDPHCQDISIALYRQSSPEGPVFLVQTYSRRPGAVQRLDFIAGAMAVLGGMRQSGPHRLRFPCGEDHELACRRVFLEACKLDGQSPAQARSLRVFDKKSNCQLNALALGGGHYRIKAEGEDESRVAAVAAGLVKLGKLGLPADDQVVFPCGQAHDELVGVLLVRALNVRAALREQELAAARGMLVAPSAQQQ